MQHFQVEDDVIFNQNTLGISWTTQSTWSWNFYNACMAPRVRCQIVEMVEHVLDFFHIELRYRSLFWFLDERLNTSRHFNEGTTILFKWTRGHHWLQSICTDLLHVCDIDIVMKSSSFNQINVICANLALSSANCFSTAMIVIFEWTFSSDVSRDAWLNSVRCNVHGELSWWFYGEDYFSSFDSP